ncbi:MORN repeat-containing protein [Pseudomonadota bacterium]
MLGKYKGAIFVVAVCCLVSTQAAHSAWYELDEPSNCSHWFPFQDEKNVINEVPPAKWSGTCKNGRIHGPGKLTFFTEVGKTVIEGDFENGRLDQPGTIVGKILFRNKVVDVRYDGEFKETAMHGQGEYCFDGAFCYAGRFLRGHPAGWVHIAVVNGPVIEGEIELSGEIEQGTISYTDGDTYEGEIQNFEPNGQGVMTEADGTRLEGQFVDRLLREGTLLAPSGLRMEGRFEDGRLSGAGVVVTPQGHRFEGMYENGWIVGVGKLIFSDGSYYEGHFDKTDRSGTGQYVDFRGFSYKGEFASDQFDGHGVFTDPAGDTCEGEWKADVLVGTGKGYMNGKAVPCIADERSIITFLEH